MNVYFVDANELIERLSLQELTDACRPVVAQLVRRYELADKNLMSVGAGGSHEEAAFLREGMRRGYLFDIDEYKSIEPILRRINRPERKADTSFVYFIDDFTRVQPPSNDIERIDLLYFASFTPDEMRRGEISARHRSGSPELSKVRSWLEWFVPAEAPLEASVADPDWPRDASPLHDSVLAAIDRFLAPGGYFVLQSYYAGVNVERNPNYVALWKRVLAKHKVDLMEVYYFKAAPAVTLWIGRKRVGRERGDEVRHILNELARRPSITRFHTRAMLEDCTVAKLELPS